MEQNAVGGEQVLDPNVLSRLCLAREALDAGFQAARDPLAYARMRAVLAFDEAIELVVVTLLPPSGNPPKFPKPGKPLDEYLALLVHGYPELAAHLALVGRVRRNRNAVKHEGTVPSLETVQESATAADHFIRSAVRAALRLELEEVTPLTLVPEGSAKEHLRAALNSIRGGDFVVACREAAVAFHGGKHAFFGSLPVRYTVDDVYDAVSSALSGPIPSKIVDAIRRLSYPFTLARFGVDPGELRRFEELTPHVLVYVSGRVEPDYGTDLKQTKDEAVFVVDFVIRALARFDDWLRKNPRHRRDV